MNSYKPYSAYKDSEVECLGQIPNHWSNVLLKYHFEENKERNKGNIEANILSLSYGKVISKQGKENFGLVPESFETYQIINRGYLIFRFTDLQNDHKSLRVGFSSQRGIITSAYIGLKAKSKEVDSKFYYYLFHSLDIQKYFYGFGGGVRLSLDWSTLSKIKYPFPPKSEQTAIADFLDQKTAEIQKFIELKEKTIALLQERKQAIINQAVTKGLDPNVEMKDSGIEWLGEIPAHWEVKKLKYLVSKVGSGVTPSGGASVYVEEGIPLLRSQNVHFGKIDLKDVAFISKRTHDGMAGSKVREDDVLLNITGGSIGRCHYVSSEIGEANVNQHVCIIRPKKNLKSQYLNSLLASRLGQYQVWFYQYGGGREGLNFQNIKGFHFPFPDSVEQNQILKYINIVSKELDQLSSQAEREITLIKEYQQSLISAAVTGKIDVRELSESEFTEWENEQNLKAAEPEGVYEKKS